MELLGKTLIKGSVEKHLRSLSCTSEGDIAPETTNSAAGGEDKNELQELMREKREKMLREQAQRRAERAKAREEVRMRHNIKSSELDKDYIEQAPSQSIFDMDGSEGPTQIALHFATKIQSTWLQVKDKFSGQQ